MKLEVFCVGFGFYQELLAQHSSLLCCHSRSQIWEIQNMFSFTFKSVVYCTQHGISL